MSEDEVPASAAGDSMGDTQNNAASDPQQPDLTPDAGPVVTDDKQSPPPDLPPEVYEKFAVPEGMKYSEDAAQKFSTVAKDLGLSQAKAQQLVNLYGEMVAGGTKARLAEWQAIHAEWDGQIKADAEFGGAKLPETVIHVDRAIDSFGEPGLREALKHMQVDKHPMLIRTFARIGMKLQEAPMLSAPSSASRNSSRMADVMFGK